VSLAVAQRVAKGAAGQPGPFVRAIDHGRSAARQRWGHIGQATLALAVAVVGAGLVCIVTLGLGKLTTSAAVVRTDRPAYRFFLLHRQAWLTTPLSWATHVGEYPEMTAIALAGAIVVGFQVSRLRLVLTIALCAALIPLLASIGHAYNWVDVGAFVVFAAAAALLRRQSLLLAAILMATMPAEKYLQSAVSTMLHGTMPSAATAVGGVGPLPSGGCARIVISCGMVGYLLARAYRSRRVSIGIAVGCAVIAYFEAFTRIYLGKHWAVDCLGGLFFGAGLLTVFIAGTRAYVGPLPAPETSALRPARRRVRSLRPREVF
jgi:hypothetical protein